MTTLTSTVAKTSANPRARSAAKSRNQVRPLVRGTLLLALVSGAIWIARSWVGSGTPGGAVSEFVVAPQSFNVVLKEKGELKAAKSADVKCEVEGKSTIISLIDEGTPVKEGDLLVELASNEIDDRKIGRASCRERVYVLV